MRSITLVHPALPLLLGLAACGPTVVSVGAGAGGAAGHSGVTTTATAGSGTGGGVAHTEPPPPPAGGLPPGVGSATFAITKLYFGDTDRDGTPDKHDGWRQYGFDLDGKISTAASTDLCILRDNASPKYVYPDGQGGLDNSFGRNILPILLGISPDFAQQQNDALVQGQPTLLFDVQHLGPNASYNGLLGRVYTGLALGQPPKLDGTDLWPVDPASLLDPADLGSAITRLDPSYLTGDTWVGLAQGEIDLPLPLDATVFPLVLRIQRAVVTLQLDPSHQHGTSGTIAGVLVVDTLVSDLKKALYLLNPCWCGGATCDSITAQLTQAADILQNGSQDPSQPCDAISIGLGFDAEGVHLGPIGPAVPPPVQGPCN